MTKAIEIYISTDIEADGPIPGPYSMLSFASAAYSANKTLLSTYSANLETLPDAGTHPKTMEWWNQFPDAWAACRREPRAPETVMREYLAWLQSLSGHLVFVGWPATWDFMWIYWYLVRFTGERPFRRPRSMFVPTPWACAKASFAERRAPISPSAGSTQACRTRMSRSTMRSSRARCSATCTRKT